MNPLRSNTPCTLFLLAFAGLGMGGQANACSFDVNHASRYFNCVKDEAYNKVVDTANQDAKKIVDAANSSASTIKNTATQLASSTVNLALLAATKTKAVEPMLCE